MLMERIVSVSGVRVGEVGKSSAVNGRDVPLPPAGARKRVEARRTRAWSERGPRRRGLLVGGHRSPCKVAGVCKSRVKCKKVGSVVWLWAWWWGCGLSPQAAGVEVREEALEVAEKTLAFCWQR